MMLITTVICIVHKKKSTNPKNGKTKCYHYPNGGSSFHTSATSLSVLWYLGLLFPQIVKEKKVLILAQNVVRKRCIWGLFSSCEKCSVLESYRSGFTPQLHDFPSMWPWWASCFILLLLEFPPLQNEYSHSILQNCCKLWDIYIKYLACTIVDAQGWKKVAIFKSGLPWWLSGEESACQAADAGSVPGLGRSSREGNGNPLQYACLGPGQSHGQRSLVGWPHGVTKESDMT